MALEKEIEELLSKVPCSKLRDLFRQHLNECPFCSKSLKPILAMFSGGNGIFDMIKFFGGRGAKK